VPGGGAIEAALSIYLEKFATTIETREQLAIAEFAQSILVIPKILSINSAFDSNELVSELRKQHNLYQKDSEKYPKYKNYGLDLEEGKIIDNIELGVIEPAATKISILQLATEAAISILRIDDLIKLNPKPEPEKDNHGHY
jgi:T-complex protein 1 subunit alpha